ncbi:hypothetical protein C6P40_003030 [Pichia californica]|uniref:Vacuolar protein sorting-associated protein 51 homolog n=1 Tax=Pichia californica TaxID=460514 RepID=A0A9P6WH29_9ASCO|nr:hypothetical protein C6P42_002756 [[Candida] californica]KAG0687010.1 hypothetical protein C6P40_003030 [[Candida] californica]
MDNLTSNSNNKSALQTIQEQRAALKNFYNLKKDDKRTGEIPDDVSEDNNLNTSRVSLLHKNSSSNSIGGIDPESIDDMDEFVATESYINILKVENKVLDKLNSAKSEIKSTIYNNYYELIKINNILGDLIKPNDSDVHADTITDNLNTIRENMKKIKSLDIDVFDDMKQEIDSSKQ